MGFPSALPGHSLPGPNPCSAVLTLHWQAGAPSSPAPFRTLSTALAQFMNEASTLPSAGHWKERQTNQNTMAGLPRAVELTVASSSFHNRHRNR
jgi:hypothetical protein